MITNIAKKGGPCESPFFQSKSGYFFLNIQNQAVPQEPTPGSG